MVIPGYVGLAVNHAFAHGLPVLYPEWMEEGHTYEAAVPYSETTFADQVRYVCVERANWSRLSDTARATAQPPPFVVSVTPGTTTYTFYVRRATAGQATTITFGVRDNCGIVWPSLVGGGPTAF